MANGYNRQSTFANGDVIDANDFNSEFDQLAQAFDTAEGHNHDGTSSSYVPLIRDDFTDTEVTTLVSEVTMKISGNQAFTFDASGLINGHDLNAFVTAETANGNYAPLNHTHSISEIIGLQTELDNIAAGSVLSLDALTDVSYLNGSFEPTGLDQIVFSSADVPSGATYKVYANSSYGMTVGALEEITGNGSYVQVHTDKGITLRADGIVRLDGRFDQTNNQPELHFCSGNQTIDTPTGNFVGFKLPAGLTEDTLYLLPQADGDTGQFLTTDGAGVLSWDTVGSVSNIEDLSNVSKNFNEAAYLKLKKWTNNTPTVGTDPQYWRVSGPTSMFINLDLFNLDFVAWEVGTEFSMELRDQPETLVKVEITSFLNTSNTRKVLFNVIEGDVSHILATSNPNTALTIYSDVLSSLEISYKPFAQDDILAYDLAAGEFRPTQLSDSVPTLIEDLDNVGKNPSAMPKYTKLTNKVNSSAAVAVDPTSWYMLDLSTERLYVNSTLLPDFVGWQVGTVFEMEITDDSSTKVKGEITQIDTGESTGTTRETYYFNVLEGSLPNVSGAPDGSALTIYSDALLDTIEVGAPFAQDDILAYDLAAQEFRPTQFSNSAPTLIEDLSNVGKNTVIDTAYTKLTNKVSSADNVSGNPDSWTIIDGNKLVMERYTTGPDFNSFVTGSTEADISLTGSSSTLVRIRITGSGTTGGGGAKYEQFSVISGDISPIINAPNGSKLVIYSNVLPDREVVGEIPFGQDDILAYDLAAQEFRPKQLDIQSIPYLDDDLTSLENRIEDLENANSFPVTLVTLTGSAITLSKVPQNNIYLRVDPASVTVTIDHDTYNTGDTIELNVSVAGSVTLAWQDGNYIYPDGTTGDYTEQPTFTGVTGTIRLFKLTSSTWQILVA